MTPSFTSESSDLRNSVTRAPGSLSVRESWDLDSGFPLAERRASRMESRKFSRGMIEVWVLLSVTATAKVGWVKMPMEGESLARHSVGSMDGG